MKCKLLILTSVAIFDIVSNPITLFHNDKSKNERVSQLKYIKTQDYIPYFDFKNMHNDDIKNMDISSMDEMDIINLNYQLIFDKQLFAFGLSQDAESDFKPSSLIKFYLDTYYENSEYDRFIFDYVKEIKLLKYPTIGTARLQFILKPNKSIKMRVINGTSEFLNKIYLLEDSFSFSIVNFNTNKEAMVNDQEIDVSTTSLSTKLARDLKPEDIINNLFQFSNEPIITNPLFITNYERQDFFKVFEVFIKNTKYTNLERNLSGKIILKPLTSNLRSIQPFIGGEFDFTLIGFKPNVVIHQVTSSINVSSNINFRKMKASEFESGKYSNKYIERFLSSFVNYADTPTLQNVLIQTSLTYNDFNYVLDPEFEVGAVDDVNGKILNNKIIYKIPINNEGTIFEEKTIIFNIVGFKKNIAIKMSDLKEIVVNKFFNNISVDEIDNDFIISNLFQFESNILNNGYIGCSNTTIDGFQQYAIKSIEIKERNLIDGYVIINLCFNDGILINNTSTNEFTYKISGFKKNINIYFTDYILDINNQNQLRKYSFLNDNVFKQNQNVGVIEQYVKTNLTTILSQVFTFNYDNQSSVNLFSTNTSKSTILKTFDKVTISVNNVLGYIDIIFGQTTPINGLNVNGSINLNEIKLRITGYDKQFTASFNNLEYLKKDKINIDLNNLNQASILDSELFSFENKNQSINNIITTSISKENFIDNFLKSIIFEKEEALGTIYIQIEFNTGFINDLDKLWVCIYGYNNVNQDFIKHHDIENITNINEFINCKTSDFSNENALSFINYKNTNKKYSILDVNCSKAMFDNVIFQTLNIQRNDDSVKVSFKLNNQGKTEIYSSTIKGFIKGINYPLIISLSIVIPILIIGIIIATFYLYKKRKIIKESEND